METEIKYPCLMQNKEAKEVVLFTSEQTGIVVIPTGIETDRALGYSSRVWVMNWFKPLEGKLVIEQS